MSSTSTAIQIITYGKKNKELHQYTTVLIDCDSNIHLNQDVVLEKKSSLEVKNDDDWMFVASCNLM
jgi:hypothetical protein